MCPYKTQGPVLFDQSGDRQGLTRIEQLQFDKEVRVAIFDPSLPVDQQFSMDKEIMWNGWWSQYSIIQSELYNIYIYIYRKTII